MKIMDKITQKTIIVLLVLVLTASVLILKELTKMNIETELLRSQYVKTEMQYIETKNYLIEVQQTVEKFLNVLEIEQLEVSGYAPHDNISGLCSSGDPNSTATGTKPAHGTVAVNPKIFPYGTVFYIPGYGWGKAQDTGGMILQRSDLIDVYFKTYEEAINWGRQTKKVIVIGGYEDES